MNTARIFLYNNTRLLMLRQKRRVFLHRALWVLTLSGVLVDAYLIYSI